MTPEVWNYIFLGKKTSNKCKVSKAALEQMRREFLYWYPVDVRCSGKDLIQNHLTFYLYCHTAIWDQETDKWPKGVRVNGHLLLNSAKVSHSFSS